MTESLLFGFSKAQPSACLPFSSILEVLMCKEMLVSKQARKQTKTKTRNQNKAITKHIYFFLLLLPKPTNQKLRLALGIYNMVRTK